MLGPSSMPPAIMFMTNELSRAGAETQIYRLARVLAARGAVVHVASMLPPRAYADELREAGVHVHVLGSAPSALAMLGEAVPAFTRLVSRARPDVVVAFLFHASNLARLVCRPLGVPLITSIRSESFVTRRRERVERLCQHVQTDDLVVCNSELVRGRLVDQGVMTPARTITVGNAIDVSSFANQSPSSREDLRASLDIGPETFAWMAVAAYRPEKDLPGMLRAFARVRSSARTEGRTVALRVAGGGEPDDAWFRLLAELELDDDVAWAGTRDDIPAFLQASDAVVLSSKYEGLPNAVLEGLAAGKPVVSTDVGGVRELLEDGVSGALVPPGDHEALAREMWALMRLDPARRAEMGAAGRRHITARFDVEAVADQWLAAIDEAISGAHRRPMARLHAALRSARR